jgi:uncharacterized protein involved in exopolysaccharide biosynthesis
VIRRSWWIALLGFVASLAAAAVATSRQRPVYRASAVVIVAPNSDVEGTSDILRSLETLDRRSVIATFARIPPTAEALAAAAQRLGPAQPELGGYNVAASVLPNTNVIRIDVEGPDGRTAADVANALAAVTKEEIRGLYRIFTLKVLAEARTPDRPARPDLGRNLVVAGILGLFLGVAASFAADRARARES